MTTSTMALESWLSKVKLAISIYSSDHLPGRRRKKPDLVGILAFEIAGLMSKLVHIWRSLSDAHVSRLRHGTIALPGVRMLVSDDDSFLLRLACAELADSVRVVADSVAALAPRCADAALRRFGPCFRDFADSGRDPYRWAMGWKEMEAKAKKMDRHVAAAAALYKKMDELAEMEHALKKTCGSGNSASKLAAAAEIQKKLFWQMQQVKHLKQASLWSATFHSAVALLSRAAFTVLARIKYVFGIGAESCPAPRSLQPGPAAVYPSSPPLEKGKLGGGGFFDTSSALLTPPPSTLGEAGLALHYANVVAVVEKMARVPRAVGAEAREELYGMLPASIRGRLRARLRGLRCGAPRDTTLAAEWRAAVARIAEWLGPVARDTVRWQAERSFERRSAAAPRAHVLLLQTLYFANREKVEAAVTEMLVGLNYLWRFEREMTALALFAAVDHVQNSTNVEWTCCSHV